MEHKIEKRHKQYLEREAMRPSHNYNGGYNISKNTANNFIQKY